MSITGLLSLSPLLVSLLRVTLILATVLVAERLFFKTDPAFRCRVLLSGLVLVILVPLISLSGIGWDLPVNVRPMLNPAASWHTSAGSPELTVVAASPENSGGVSHGIRPLFLIWLVPALVLGLRILAGLWWTRRSVRHGLPVRKGFLSRITENLAAKFNIRRRVELVESPDVRVPMTWRLRHPQLILPRKANSWTPGQSAAVLAHELAHVKRLDYGTALAAKLVLAVLWFHPLAWILVRRLSLLAEQACDACVIRLGIKPSDYAGYLLQLRRESADSPFSSAVASVPGMAGSQGLTNRLQEMLKKDFQKKEKKMKSRFLFFGVMMITLFLAITASPRAGKDMQKERLLYSDNGWTLTAEQGLRLDALLLSDNALGACIKDKARGTKKVLLISGKKDGTWSVLIPGVSVRIAKKKGRHRLVLRITDSNFTVKAVKKGSAADKKLRRFFAQKKITRAQKQKAREMQKKIAHQQAELKKNMKKIQAVAEKIRQEDMARLKGEVKALSEKKLKEIELKKAVIEKKQQAMALKLEQLKKAQQEKAQAHTYEVEEIRERAREEALHQKELLEIKEKEKILIREKKLKKIAEFKKQAEIEAKKAEKELREVREEAEATAEKELQEAERIEEEAEIMEAVTEKEEQEEKQKEKAEQAAMLKDWTEKGRAVMADHFSDPAVKAVQLALEMNPGPDKSQIKQLRDMLKQEGLNCRTKLNKDKPGVLEIEIPRPPGKELADAPAKIFTRAMDWLYQNRAGEWKRIRMKLTRVTD